MIIFFRETFGLFSNPKYRRIILIYFGIISIILLGGCYEVVSSYRSEILRAETQASNLSHVLEEQLNGTFKKIDLVMQEVARVIKKENLTPTSGLQEIKELFNQRKKVLPDATSFVIIDSLGYMTMHEGDGGTENTRLYVGDRDHFTHQAYSYENELYVSLPLVSRLTHNSVVYLSRRLTDTNDKFIGIVATGIPLKYFQELYSKLDVGKNGAITLFSNENILYSRYPWDPSLVGKVLKNRGVITELFKKNQSVYTALSTSSIDQMVRYNSSRRVAETKFVITVGISRNEVLADWQTRSTFYFFGALILCIGGGIYLIYFLKSLQSLEESRKAAIHNAKLSSLGEMAAGIAHEINNPLTVIHTLSSQLNRQIQRDKFDPEAFTKSLTRINLTVERIAKIIRGLKSFSRTAENDHITIIPLSHIVENTLELCTEKFRHQCIILKIDPVPPILLNCREAQLVQVLLNLLNNSYDAVENLPDKWVHLSFEVDRFGILALYVRDSGNGIPDKIAQNIMQPFFTTKEIGKGTGLGLSISKGIIEDHDGQLYLDPKSPNTCFVLKLPVALEQSVVA